MEPPNIHGASALSRPGKAVVRGKQSRTAESETAPGVGYTRQRNSESPPLAAHTEVLSEFHCRYACPVAASLQFGESPHGSADTRFECQIRPCRKTDIDAWSSGRLMLDAAAVDFPPRSAPDYIFSHIGLHMEFHTSTPAISASYGQGTSLRKPRPVSKRYIVGRLRLCPRITLSAGNRRCRSSECYP